MWEKGWGIHYALYRLQIVHGGMLFNRESIGKESECKWSWTVRLMGSATNIINSTHKLKLPHIAVMVMLAWQLNSRLRDCIGSMTRPDASLLRERVNKKSTKLLFLDRNGGIKFIFWHFGLYREKVRGACTKRLKQYRVSFNCDGFHPKWFASTTRPNQPN